MLVLGMAATTTSWTAEFSPLTTPMLTTSNGGQPIDLAATTSAGTAELSPLPPPILNTSNGVQAIDLATTLRLANARNLDIQIARQRVAEAKATHESTLLQFLPWLSPGISYRRHDDLIQ